MISETITFKFDTPAQQAAFHEVLNGSYMSAGGEHKIALELANKLLDSPHCDPDDDVRVLARQLIRTSERAGSTKVVLSNLLDALWDSGAIFADDSEVGIAAGKAWTHLGERPMRPRPDSPASASAETNASPVLGTLKEGTPSAGSALKCRDPVCSIKGDHYLTDACDQMKE